MTKIAVAKAGLVVGADQPDAGAGRRRRPDRAGRADVGVRRRRALAKARRSFAETGPRRRRDDPDRRRGRAGAASPSPTSSPARRATEPDVEIHGDDIWELIFTSGTTAMPKGGDGLPQLLLPQRLLLRARLTRGLRFECDLKMVTFLPLIYHIADQIFSLPGVPLRRHAGVRAQPDAGRDRRRRSREEHVTARVGRLAGDARGS